LDKVYSNSDENNYQRFFFLDTDPVQHVNPHRHMLRLTVPRLEPMPTPAEDKDASQFDTAPMRAIRRKQAKKQIRTFFANLMVILLGVLFLGLLATITIVITGSVAKIEAFVIFLIALSYITSLQVKHIHLARKQAYLTAPQLLQVDKEIPTPSKDEDMEHLKLIKQDTSTYLHGLVAKDLERTF
jgi:hypothetical protein